jgi:hypothetical protein
LRTRRCFINVAWFSSERTATNRIEGRATASQIAAASAASFLCGQCKASPKQTRHHPRPMAKRDQRSRPVMRRSAGPKPHNIGGHRSKKLQQLVAPHRFGEHNPPRRINAVNLKDALGQIESNSRNSHKFDTQSVVANIRML